MSIDYEEQMIIHNSIGFAALSFLLYDHLITLAEEVAYIWARPKRASAILFLVNRYLGCFSTIAQAVMLLAVMSPEVRLIWPSCFCPVLFEYLAISLSSEVWVDDVATCVQYIHYRQVLLFVNQTIVCILFMIRTYALYGRSKRLLVFFLLTSLALASPVVWSLVGQQATSATNVPGCQMIYNTNTAIHLAVPYEALCVFDTLIFGLTAYKTFDVGVRSNAHSKPNLVMLLFRDGAIYFALMLNLHKTTDTGIFSSHRQHLTGGRGGTIFTSQVLGPDQGWDLPTVTD
ncbi:hypothetical protein F5J12DRAFT_929400 [Pisolithus orientalis]|uniref:uncharacterized protein n=1 Tax=Pisolithus orientalis TaxID=936130 RepID=UPI002223FDDF|nr:uncharacterized protein F5J12DRAFT_929400 [Pisolithus orientalis]KAI5994932.1 hypothetical protein F5J12DRAFT_929400 [Pisolithus orientalis]